MSMKVYARRNGVPWHVGYADIPRAAPHKLRLMQVETDRCIYITYSVEEVRITPEDGGRPFREHAVILENGQTPNLLPGWRPVEN